MGKSQKPGAATELILWSGPLKYNTERYRKALHKNQVSVIPVLRRQR